MVDSRETEVDLMEKLVDLTILYKIRANLNGGIMEGKIEWKGGDSYRGGTSSYQGRGNSYSRGGFCGDCFKCGK